MSDIKRRATNKTIKPSGPTSLPDDVQTDLRHVIEYLKKPNATGISESDFRSIIHNFGRYGIRKSEFEKLLWKHNLGQSGSNFSDTEVINMVTALWCSEGKDSEASDCFRVFDKQ